MKWWQGLILLGLVVGVIWVAGERLQSNEADPQQWPQGPASEDHAQRKIDTQDEAETSSAGQVEGEEGQKLELDEVNTKLPRDFAWVEEGPAVDSQAPEFTLQGMDGKTYQLGDFRGQKPVVVNFWASWCPPCEMEAPDLVYLYEKYKDKIEIFAVNLTSQDTFEDARAFAQRHGFAFPVLLDQKGSVARDYQVLSIPTSYFIDKDGIIRHKLIGITTRGRLEAMFQELIEQR